MEAALSWIEVLPLVKLAAQAIVAVRAEGMHVLLQCQRLLGSENKYAAIVFGWRGENNVVAISGCFAHAS